ncbi:hypothetical protein EBU60_01910, partial [bacterium]|nr:hypothetical protein [bacterium]
LFGVAGIGADFLQVHFIDQRPMNTKLHLTLMETPEFVAGDIGEGLRQSFHITNDEYMATGGEDGTTACALVIRGNTLHVANAGDSRAVVCGYDGSRRGLRFALRPWRQISDVRSTPIRCATRLRRTSSMAGPTSASCRNYSDMRISQRPSSTPTSLGATCGIHIGRPTRGPKQPARR